MCPSLACWLVLCPADNPVVVSDYTKEPKYAAEVPQQQPGPAELDTDTANKLHTTAADPKLTPGVPAAAAAPAGPDSSSDGDGRGGVPTGSGKGQVLSVDKGVGAAGVGGALQKQEGGGADARHLDAIFAPPAGNTS
jgi:hypothetical protein